MDRDVRHPMVLIMVYMLLGTYLAYGMVVVWQDTIGGILSDREGQLFLLLRMGWVLGACCRVHWAVTYSLMTGMFLITIARGATWAWCRITGEAMARKSVQGMFHKLGIAMCMMSCLGTAALAAGSVAGTVALSDMTFGDANGAGPMVGMFAVPMMAAACFMACILSVFWSLCLPFLIRHVGGWAYEMAGGTVRTGKGDTYG